MKERSVKWQPIADITHTFGGISYSCHYDTLTVQMVGERTLALSFSGVVAVRSELECPGTFHIPRPLPMLRELQTFPLLLIEESQWLKEFLAFYPGRSHFALISSDLLLHVIASPNVVAQWEI